MSYVRIASGTHDLRRRLFDVSDQWAPSLLGTGMSLSIFRRLGVDVRTTELGSLSGACRLDGTGAEVFVSRADHLARQRFTAAHEIAHLVMRDVDRTALNLHKDEHERMCDSFAQRLLIPPADLEGRAAGWSGDPQGLLNLAAIYGVGIAAIQRATARRQADCDQLVIAAEVRGHPRRPEEVALRAQRVLVGDFFVPADVRLSSLGLNQVSAWLEARGEESTSTGFEPQVAMPIWRQARKGRSGTARGPASWTALYLRGSRALVSLHTSRLDREWSCNGMPALASAG